MGEQQPVLETPEVKAAPAQSRGEPSKWDLIKFEQYKLMVGSTFEISKNRHTANSFFLTVTSILLGAVSLFQGVPKFGAIVLSVVGMLIAVMWNRNIISYKTINKVKFQIIHEMEDELPVALFNREQEELIKNGHKLLTAIEIWIPWLFALAFGLNICYILLFV